MKRKEETADLEAPERNSPLLLCQRCFAMIPGGADFCPECGAPAVEDFGEGSESAVYPELARANLLRMRGEYKQAEEICLAILRKHPNSGTANTLLGDICSERGDLRQAAEWYEMALDLMPDSASDQAKLEHIRRRIKEHETASTAKQLGLPESRPKIGLWVGSILVFVALVAATAFLLGERTQARRSKPSEVLVPVTVPPVANRETPPDTKLEEPAVPVTVPLLDRIKAAAGEDARRLVAAARVPETMAVLLTATVAPGEDARQVGVRLARLILPTVSDAPSTTVIGIRDGKLVYFGTMTREKFDAASTEEWRAANGEDLVAFANATMSDEWMPAPPEPATPETP